MSVEETLDFGSDGSPELQGRVWVNSRVSVGREGDLQVVFAGGIPLAQYVDGDLGSKRHAMVLLSETGLAQVNEVAKAFGTDRVTIFRNRQKYKQDGLSGLVPSKRGPKGPSKLGAARDKKMLKLKEEGLPNTQIAQRLGVTEGAIRRRLKQLGYQGAAEGHQDKLALAPGELSSIGREEPVEVEQAGPSECEVEFEGSGKSFVPEGPESWDTDPADRRIDRMLARVGLLEDAAPLFGTRAHVEQAGVLLAIPALVASGVFEVAHKLYGSLGPAFYGLRTTVLVLLLMGLLRVRRPEQLKQHRPDELGAVLGLDRAPEVKTLRRKLTKLAARGRAHEFVQEMAEQRINQYEEALGFLYVDGHVRPYHGKHKLAKAFVPRRRLAMPATTDYWVNDTSGQPLLVMTAPANEALSGMLEPVLDEVEQLLGERRATVVFDRGGWSPKMFARILKRDFDILTYRKGKRRRIPKKRFREHVLKIEGRELSYQLYESKVRFNRGKLKLRQIVRLTDDGHQTVIVTSRWDMPAAELAYRMFERWRQENFFKYMRQEYAIDSLLDYEVRPDAPEREIPNPKRKKLEKQLRDARQQQAQLEQQLGASAADNSESQRRTMRGFKIAHAEIGKSLRKAQEKVQKLQSQLKKVPRRVALGEVPERADTVRLSFEKKHLTDALKMIAYQAETSLHNQLALHYKRNSEDGRKLLTEAFCTSGSLFEHDSKLVAQLDSLSSPHRTQALSALCRELNQASTPFPGTDLVLEYHVKGSDVAQKPVACQEV
jgi:transposase